MNPGDLDQRIAVWKNETTTNKLNEEQPKFTPLKRMWAKVETRTGSLIKGRPADTMLSKTTHVITVRAASIKGITEDCCIRWVDLVGVEHKFEIDYIVPPTRGSAFTSIYVQEAV